MSNIKIYIDGQLADLPDNDLNLNLTYSLKDKDGIAINSGSRSEYSFELPATKQNNAIYSRFFDVSEDTETVQGFLDARIEVDGITFFVGKCQMKSVTLRPDLYYWQGEKYKVAFFGNNIDWTVQLKDKYLYQYDYGQHTFGRAANLSAWGNTYGGGDNYLYTVIKLKDWNLPNQIDPLESTPALFVRTIVDKIFADLAYTVSSNFFDTDFFKRLIMPVLLPERFGADFSEDYFSVKAEKALSPLLAFESPIIINTQTQAPAVGANPYNIATGEYVVPYDGFFLISYRADLTNFAGALDFITEVGQNFVLVPNSQVGSISGGTSYNSDVTIKGEIVVQAVQGDIITFAYGIFGAGTADYTYYIEITGEADIVSGVLMDFKYFLNKDWNALEFIKGLGHAFNLTFQTDADLRTVEIEPANDYVYLQRNPITATLESGFYTAATDKTQKVDLLRGGEVTNDTEQDSRIRFAWKKDSNDPTFEAINEGAELGLLESRFIYTADRFKNGEIVIENPFFAGTLCYADNQVGAGTTAKTPIFPIIWKENYLELNTSNERLYDSLPRLLVSEELDPTNNGLVKVTAGGFGVFTVDVAPCAYMVDYNNTDGNFISLSFGTETVNGNSMAGLLERFYLLDFVRRQAGKQVECYLQWSTTDIRNLNFRERVRIHGDNFILQEVNSFNVLSNRSTKTYLLYDAQGDGTEQNQIENTNIKTILGV